MAARPLSTCSPATSSPRVASCSEARRTSRTPACTSRQADTVSRVAVYSADSSPMIASASVIVAVLPEFLDHRAPSLCEARAHGVRAYAKLNHNLRSCVTIHRPCQHLSLPRGKSFQPPEDIMARHGRFDLSIIAHQCGPLGHGI